jgi:hypothetical protein
MTTDPSDDLVSFLRSNVNTGNISVPFTSADDIDHADPDGPRSFPKIAISAADASPVEGGQTGFSGIDPGGNGPIQDVIVSIQVDCWAGPETVSAYQTNSVHPDHVAAEMSTEVHTSCLDAAADNAPSGYHWIAADPPRDADDTEVSETEYRDIVIVRLKYTET